ncbi:hypothetical protein ABET52_18890 [Saccharococcus caldoxylosilyticus]|nr:hypothetical protein [Parageobacillus caldoxylosilyticus]
MLFSIIAAASMSFGWITPSLLSNATAVAEQFYRSATLSAAHAETDAK